MGVTSVMMRRWALCWSTEQSYGSGERGNEEISFMLVHRAVRWEGECGDEIGFMLVHRAVGWE